MSKIELDDQILRHPKFRRAVARGGSAVIHMWLALRAYCAQQLTDGHIPIDMIDFVDGPTDSRSKNRAISCLADSNLLHRTDTGWFLHDYLDHSSSRAQVIAWREANRTRKRNSRGMSRRDGERDTPVTPPVTPPVTDGVTTSGLPAPSPSLISDLSKKIPLPPNRTATRPRDRCGDSMAGAPGTRPEVIELHTAWKLAIGRPNSPALHGTGDDAYDLAAAIKHYGLPDCLLVAAESPRDGMVNGTKDDKGSKHESIHYIFGKEETFSRILAAAKQRTETADGAPRKNFRQKFDEQLNAGRLRDE